MSEYQYYEFLAVDRPLTDVQQAEVRMLSSRAHITATSFTNEYHWGDFGGDPRRMMELYYDAHLYLANWGTRRLMLRLPQHLLGLDAVAPYQVDDLVEAWTAGEHLIVDLSSEDEEGEWHDDMEMPLSALVGVRTELAGGDLRPLYLAWLAAFGTWERDEDAFDYEMQDELEPPVPPGLGALSGPQRALADFLRLDPDLLAVAAEASPAAAPDHDDPRELARWVAALAEGEKNALLQRVAQGDGTRVHLELLRGFRGEPKLDGRVPRRTVAELLDAAAEHRQAHT
jgi:hypothetical protein